MKDTGLNRKILLISRIVIGLVFIFSGFVKGVDPLGSAYKFGDYFDAFGLPFLEFLATPLSVFLSMAEFLLGIIMITGYRLRTGAWGVLLFMSFFSVLTFILALTNPVSDCGCFGDALIMTNWQTFTKNMILMPLVLAVFFGREIPKSTVAPLKEWSYLFLLGAGFVIFQFFNLNHLPVLDFRPYKIGTYIPDAMTIPEGAPQDEFKTILYYEKNGQTEAFDEETFPWQDSTWKFVDSKHELINKGYEPPIHDFTITDESGYDITNDVLADEGYSFLFITGHIGKANKKALVWANELYAISAAYGHSFYCLTSSTQDDIQASVMENDLSFPFHTADEITLKTIIRSNPGLLILKNGLVLAKLHYRDFPETEMFSGNILKMVLDSYRRKMEMRLVVLLTVLLAGILVSMRLAK